MVIRELGDRRDFRVRDQLVEIIQQERGPRALYAFWALNAAGGLSAKHLTLGLMHPNPDVQRWAVRLLGDEGIANFGPSSKMIDLASSAEDGSPAQPVGIDRQANRNRTFDTDPGAAANA